MPAAETAVAAAETAAEAAAETMAAAEAAQNSAAQRPATVSTAEQATAEQATAEGRETGRLATATKGAATMTTTEGHRTSRLATATKRPTMNTNEGHRTSGLAADAAGRRNVTATGATGPRTGKVNWTTAGSFAGGWDVSAPLAWVGRQGTRRRESTWWRLRNSAEALLWLGHAKRRFGHHSLR